MGTCVTGDVGSKLTQLKRVLRHIRYHKELDELGCRSGDFRALIPALQCALALIPNVAYAYGMQACMRDFGKAASCTYTCAKSKNHHAPIKAEAARPALP
jgi:hypothetical protein